MKTGYSILIILTIVVLATALTPVHGNKLNLDSCKTPLSPIVPQVILQPGTSGTAVISANGTSAQVSISGPAGIQHNYAFNASSTKVTTTSGTAVDDIQAVLNVVLSQNSTIFIIYNAGSNKGSTENLNGKGCTINIDGVDVAVSWQSPNSANTADSVTVVYGTNLTAGSHVIKGRFFANSAGSTVTIDTRQIVAFWFPSVVASYARSTTVSQTNSLTPMDDPPANATFTLNANSAVFIVYNAGNRAGSTEPDTGKGVTINVDGTDIATNQSESPWDYNYANSVTIAYVGSLGTGSHTVKGRFFSNLVGNTTTIDERQLIVFCFSASQIAYGFVQSTTAASTSSTTAVNDAQAILSPTLGNDSDSLAMYIGGNLQGATEGSDGKGVRLNVDGTDMTNSSSWQSPDYANYADSATSLWCGSLTQGSHTIRGRFWTNTAGNTVTISNRQLLILAFPCANVLKIVNQVANAWIVYLQIYSSSNIGRLSGTIISFHDGSMSDQVVISNGSITQAQGASYNLSGGVGSTAYISFINLSTNATGTSYLYAYLRILPINSSPFNVFKITFQIT